MNYDAHAVRICSTRGVHRFCDYVILPFLINIILILVHKVLVLLVHLLLILVALCRAAFWPDKHIQRDLGGRCLLVR